MTGRRSSLAYATTFLGTSSVLVAAAILADHQAGAYQGLDGGACTPASPAVQLASCAPNTAVPQQSVFVIYLNTSPDDPRSEAAIDVQLLASGATPQGFPGTPYPGTLTQYYQPEAGAGTPSACDDGGAIAVQNVELPPDGSTCGTSTYVNIDCDGVNADLVATVESVVANCNIPSSTTLVLQYGPGLDACSPYCGDNNAGWGPGYRVMLIPYYTASNVEPGGSQYLCATDWKMGLTTAIYHEYAEATVNQWCVCANCSGDNGEQQIADICEENADSTWAVHAVQVIPSGNQPQPCSAADASASTCWPNTVQVQPLWSNEANGGTGNCVYSYEAEDSVFMARGTSVSTLSDNQNVGDAGEWAWNSTNLLAFPYNIAVTTSAPYHVDVLGYVSTSDLMEIHQIGTPTSGWVYGNVRLGWSAERLLLQRRHG